MNIWEYLSSVPSNPIFLIAAGCASILSLALAIYFYSKSRRFKCLAYSFKSTSFVRDYQSKIPELELSYKGIKLRNITLTRFVVWNAGLETIDKDDVAEADPLRLLIAEDAVFLNSEVIRPVREANVVSIYHSAGNPTTKLTFDFSDKGDGVVFDILHNGRAEDVSLVGTVKGARPLQHYPKVRAPLSRFRRRLILTTPLLAGALFYFFNTVPESQSVVRAILAIILMLLTVAAVMIYQVYGEEFMDSKALPENLRHFTDAI